MDYEHPSRWGAYLNARVLFGKITGVNPTMLGASEAAAAAIGIIPSDALALQTVAHNTLATSTLSTLKVNPKKAPVGTSN